MDNIFGMYKQFLIIERDVLKALEEKVQSDLATAQDDHNVPDIRKAKIWMEAIQWIKDNNIYKSGEVEIKR